MKNQIGVNTGIDLSMLTKAQVSNELGNAVSRVGMLKLESDAYNKQVAAKVDELSSYVIRLTRRLEKLESTKLVDINGQPTASADPEVILATPVIPTEVLDGSAQ